MPPTAERRRSDDSLRVAMIIQRFRPYFSGQGVQVEELCKALARRGVGTTLFTAVRADTIAAPDERHDGYRVRRLRCDPPGLSMHGWSSHLWSPIFAARAFVALCRERPKPDLVHVHAQTDALYAAWCYARLRRIPLLFEMTLLGADDPQTMRGGRQLLSGLRFALYRRCDGYVAISPALAAAYADAGMPAQRLRIIPQGVDTARFAPAADRRRLRAELGLPPDEPLVAFVGSLVERKGIDVVLEAWPLVQARCPQARLLLVGRDAFAAGDAEREFLEHCFARLPAEPAARVRRLGVQPAPERFLQAADVFVFPSRREGFGTAIIEAMACGLPAVVAELPGITDFIFARPQRAGAETAAGGDGVIVPQADARALAAAVRELIGAPQRAAAIGRAARERASARFDLGRIVGDYLDFYAELLRTKDEAVARS